MNVDIERENIDIRKLVFAVVRIKPRPDFLVPVGFAPDDPNVIFHDTRSDDNSVRLVVTVVEVVTTLEDAQREMQRLNELNANEDCRYTLMPTRYFVNGGPFDNEL